MGTPGRPARQRPRSLELHLSCSPAPPKLEGQISPHPSGQAGGGDQRAHGDFSRSEPAHNNQTPQSALGLFPHKGAHASQSPAGTDKGSGEAAPPRCFFAASSPRRRPRGWGGNAPPRFSDRASAREHLRACGAAQQHHQALKRFRRIGNRSAGGTADSESLSSHSSGIGVARRGWRRSGRREWNAGEWTGESVSASTGRL